MNLDETAVIGTERHRSMVALDDALAAFAEVAPRQAKIVELRYFGGLQEEEMATGYKDSKAGAAGLKHAVSALLAARQGNRRAAESENRAALAEPQGYGQFHHVTFKIACAYSVLGDVAHAQEWMKKTVEDGFPCFTLFEVEPSLERWRATSKGHEFLVNLRREWEATP